MLLMLVRTLILYFTVVLAMRLMGKRQVGELQPAELVIAIMISDLASIPMQSTGVPLLSGLVPIATLLTAELIMSYISLKSRAFRKFISGSPSIIIHHGNLNEEEMEKQRFNIDDLLEELRINDYPDITEIEYAILETGGEISIIPKTSAKAVTLGDLHIEQKQDILPVILIADGELNEKELKRAKRDKKWLMAELKKFKIEKEQDAFIALLNSKGEFFAQKKKG